MHLEEVIGSLKVTVGSIYGIMLYIMVSGLLK